MGETSRRELLRCAAPLLSVTLAAGQNKDGDPWPGKAVMQPGELARTLSREGRKPIVISVGFPVLYRQRRIVQAKPAGPASKPEGLAALREATAGLAKDAEIVIYCGCCPMEHCPNIRPAYTALRDAGFHNVRVLVLATNLRTDWTDKGYPVEPAA